GGGDGDRLAGEGDADALVALRLEDVADGGVDEGGGEGEGGVGLFGPEVAEDVVGDDDRFGGADEGGDPLQASRGATVDLAEVGVAAGAVEDLAGALVVGGEVDEGADDAVVADAPRNDGFVESVLQGDDGAGRRQFRGDDVEGGFGVLALDGEEDEVKLGGEV